MRSSGGWLTPEALRDGLREEYAVSKEDGLHTVVLGWAGYGTPFSWEVKRTRTATRPGVDTAGVLEAHSWFFDRLKDARRKWHEQVQRTAP